MKRIKYKISERGVQLYPIYFLLTLGFALIVIFAFLFIAILYTIPQVEKELIFKQVLYCIVLSILLLLPFFILSKKSILFDRNLKTVVSKTIFGERKLIDFQDIDDIARKNTGFQVGYYILRKSDRFGKGIYIGSPADSDQEFFNTILPQLRGVIGRNEVQEQIVKDKINNLQTGNFEYYKTEGSQYILKNKATVAKVLPLIIIAVVWVFIIISRLSKDTEFKADSLVVVPAIPFLVLLGTLTKRVCLNISDKLLIIKYLGITFEKDKLSDFDNFKITRNTHNGMYSGTDVRLLFIRANGKKKDSFPIYDFNKTQAVESFLTETRYIIQSIIQ